MIRPTSPNQGVEVYEIASNESTQKIQLFDGGFFVHNSIENLVNGLKPLMQIIFQASFPFSPTIFF